MHVHTLIVLGINFAITIFFTYIPLVHIVGGLGVLSLGHLLGDMHPCCIATSKPFDKN